MIRPITIAAAATSLFLFAGAANAQAPRGYHATPVTAPAKAVLLTRETVWKCGNGVCSAGKAAQRDKVLCELVVREVGPLSSFIANGAAFDAPALAKGNTKAR